MQSDAGFERRRTRWALISSAVIGLGTATAIFGIVLWRAGMTPVGVPVSALRWTVLPALFAVAAAAGWAGCLSSWMLRKRQVGNIIGWLAGVVVLIIAVVAGRQHRPPPANDARYENAISNAEVFHSCAPVVLVGAAVLLAVGAGIGRRPLPGYYPALDFSWRVWVAGALPACLLIGSGLVLPRLADSIADGANTLNRTNTAALPEPQPSELTGEVATRIDLDSTSIPEPVRATPAGLAIRSQSPGGVRMVDPNTGAVRWIWSRNDLGDGRDRMTVSADGKLLAAAFTTRDQHPRPPGLVVLDTTSGEVRATLPGNPGIPLAVTADQVITTHPNDDDLVAYGLDGTRRWTREKLPERIETYDGSEYSDDGKTLLAAVDDHGNDGRAKMLAIDLATGKDRWQLKTPPQMGYLHAVPGTDLAVVGGLDLPVSQDQDPTTSRVLAYRMTDGTKAWERTVPAPPGASRDLDSNGCHAQVDLDADHLTLLTCGPYADTLRLDAFAPQDGKPLWTQTMKTPDTGGPTPSGDDSLQAMPDGSTAMLMPAENECSIVRADASGLHKTPFRAVERSCNTVEWYRAGGTVVLRDREERVYLTLR